MDRQTSITVLCGCDHANRGDHTGAAKGIGLETARQLTEQGRRVVFTGRGAEALESATAQIRNTEWHMLDVSRFASVGFF
ncbi:MAG: SDR family NAD(P)-dependent oxidoreductase [Pseudomonadota bacterium]